MKARDIMTSDPFVVATDEVVARAAEIMRDLDIGLVPVVDNLSDMHLRGVITDRDITVRCTAAKHDAGCLVEGHMTPGPLATVAPDAELIDVLALMGEAQVRRIPVVDGGGRVIGIIAQADVATKIGASDPKAVESTLERISTPAHALR